MSDLKRGDIIEWRDETILIVSNICTCMTYQAQFCMAYKIDKMYDPRHYHMLWRGAHSVMLEGCMLQKEARRVV